MARRNQGKKAATVLPIGTQPGATREGPVVGWIVAWSATDGIAVDWPGNAKGPVSARSTIAIDEDTAAEAIASRRGVVLLFERERAHFPIIMGILQEAVTLETEIPELPVETTIDGRRVVLEAADEIVLRCGNAMIVLRRNGRVVIRGTYVETRAAGTNRIKGGSVQIN